MDVNPHSAYHAAGIKLLPGGVGVNDVACSGGIGGREHPIVLPDALHALRLAQRSPGIAASMCPRLPQRDAYLKWM